ncbi:hypothetical protein F3J16_25390 [Burkholderia sp. Ap-962]|uniref:DUF6404 family protein n=1 Tax=Burkholderia sp. Ap-962 TaxID=2608333 RepID=UPI001421E32E|nr:DUF6404 family protein [Burkholderia sp. Ap-962]NIF73491.1 hypothetical protein [Burkholderia sp. Ap-962]
MTPKLKIDRSLEILDSKGISRSSSAPFLHRMLWKIGIEIPPPHYLKWVQNFALSGVFFGPTWGALMYLLSLNRTPMSIGIAVFASMAAGAVFGICYATMTWSKGRKHGVPGWNEIN